MTHPDDWLTCRFLSHESSSVRQTPRQMHRSTVSDDSVTQPDLRRPTVRNKRNGRILPEFPNLSRNLRPQRHNFPGDDGGSRCAENPLKNRVNVLHVVPEVEHRPNSRLRQRRTDLVVSQQFFKEISVLVPDLHGVSLHG